MSLHVPAQQEACAIRRDRYRSIYQSAACSLILFSQYGLRSALSNVPQCMAFGSGAVHSRLFQFGAEHEGPIRPAA